MSTKEDYGTISRHRKKEFPFHYSPESKLFHVVARLRDDPGALASLLNALGTRLNLVSTTSYTVEDGCAISSNFGEALFDSDTAQSIQRVASRSPHVEACEVRESKDGLLVDEFHLGLQCGPADSYVMLQRAGLARMFGELVKVLGSGGETLLYLEGKNYGRSRIETYGKMFGPGSPAKLQEFSHILEALGYGSSRITFDSDNRVNLAFYDDFECCSHEKARQECSFSRGLAEGSIGAILGKELTSEETRCRLRGDEVCEFALTARIDKP
jgi:predicted hydrocarbon binding protein